MDCLEAGEMLSDQTIDFYMKKIAVEDFPSLEARKMFSHEYVLLSEVDAEITWSLKYSGAKRSGVREGEELDEIYQYF